MPRALIAFEPPDGGVAEHVGQLAVGLPAHGWEVEVAGPDAATIYPRLDDAGVPVHRIGGLDRGYGRPWRDARALRQLTRIARSGSYDLVHCHSAKAGTLGRLAARLTGVPSVYTPHCFGFVGDVSPARRLLVPPAERLLGRLTSMLICVSDAELAEAAQRRIGRSAARRRIYNGCEPCAAASPKPPSPAALRVGSIAVLRRQKGLDVLIDAATRIFAAVPEATIAIIGDGPLRAELADRARASGLDGDRRFRFVPFEPPSSRYLAELDLFVLPSFWEAFPISILEALACGVPQVATDVGGTGEAVDPSTGILIPARDPDALAEAVVELLHDPDRRRRMATASRSRWEDRFRLERMVAETAEAYLEVVGRG